MTPLTFCVRNVQFSAFALVAAFFTFTSAEEVSKLEHAWQTAES